MKQQNPVTKHVYLSVQTDDESIVKRWTGDKQQAYEWVSSMIQSSMSSTVHLQYNKSNDGFFKETVATCEIYREEHNGLFLWTVALPSEHVSIDLYPTWRRNKYSFIGKGSSTDRLSDWLVSVYEEIREELDKLEGEGACPY